MLLALVCAAAPAQQPLHEVCGSCHTTVAEDFRSHKHLGAGLDCNVCHGDSIKHRDAAGATEPDRVAGPQQVAELCGQCHVTQAEGYAASEHGKLVAAMSKTRSPNCGTCHDVHRERSFSAMKRRCQACHQELPEACSGEPAVEAKLSCAGCHRPHEFSR